MALGMNSQPQPRDLSSRRRLTKLFFSTGTSLAVNVRAAHQPPLSEDEIATHGSPRA